MTSSNSPPLPTHKPHILAIPFAAQGHINPLMRLCELLASRGCKVTFVNLDIIHQRLELCQSTPLSSVSDRSRLDITMEFLPQTGFDLSQGFRGQLQYMIETMEKSIDALRLFMKRISEVTSPVTCIISDILSSTWTQIVADEFKIPRFAFFTCSQNFWLFWVYVPLLIDKGLISIDAAVEGFPSKCDNLNINLPGLVSLRSRDLPTYKHVENETRYMYTFFIREIQQLQRVEGVLVNTFHEVEGKAIDAMQEANEFPVYSVGPLISNSGPRGTSLWLEEEHCLHWLDKQPVASVLYIAFGSLTLLSLTQFEEIVLGLEASQQRFLWVFRPDLVYDVPSNAVEYVTTRTRGLGYLVSWSPQLRVLSNPAVGGFLTHCGWNSTMESIANGVPMICWPYFSDQTMNCMFVVRDWKVGVELEREGGLVTREEVERVVRSLMEGEEGKEMRTRAAKLKEIADGSMGEGGSSYKNLEAFVENIRKRCGG